MSPTALRLLLREQRSTLDIVSRMRAFDRREGLPEDRARYPQDYYSPLERVQRGWLRARR